MYIYTYIHTYTYREISPIAPMANAAVRRHSPFVGARRGGADTDAHMAPVTTFVSAPMSRERSERKRGAS